VNETEIAQALLIVGGIIGLAVFVGVGYLAVWTVKQRPEASLPLLVVCVTLVLIWVAATEEDPTGWLPLVGTGLGALAAALNSTFRPEKPEPKPTPEPEEVPDDPGDG
jgi:hypothetical protein